MINAHTLEDYTRMCGVREGMNFAGFDNEVALRKLQAKSAELAHTLYDSRPVPVAIFEEADAAQSKLAAEALKLAEVTPQRLKAEAQAATEDVRRALSSGLKSSGKARDLAEILVAQLAIKTVGDCPAWNQFENELQRKVAIVSELLGRSQRPAWLKRYREEQRQLAGASQSLTVEAFRRAGQPSATQAE
jgi:hypothetical protein